MESHIARHRGWALALLLFAFGCADATGPGERGPSLTCTIPESEIFSGAFRDEIPALTDPPRVASDAPEVGYLQEHDRVIGLVVDDQAVAVPLNLLWWHEIVNLQVGARALAVTHCPLTGSSLVFDRGPLGSVEFGVSGLLYRTNLMMYDRRDEESLWPQMSRGARCGPRSGTPLSMVAALEMRWDAWRSLHPGTEVVAPEGSRFDYTVYPYGSYDDPDNGELLFPIGTPLDPRRPPKERVLGVPALGEGDATGGIAFPFGELDDGDRWSVASALVDGRDVAVFWDGSARAAMAYEVTLDGEVLSFRSTPDGIVDEGTGSVWSVEGWALAGPLEGRRLVPVAEAYVAFWFAWDAFHPTTRLWSGAP